MPGVTPPKRRETRYTFPWPAPEELSTVIHSLSSSLPPGVPLDGALQVMPPSSLWKTWILLKSVNPSVEK